MLSLALDVDRFMRRFHAELHPNAKRVDKANIGPFGGMVLLTIADLEPVPIHAIALHLARDKSQMTRTIQMLERKALLVRDQSSEDARVSLVSLTEQGRAQVLGFKEVMTEATASLVGGLTADEQQNLSRILGKILVDRPAGEG